MTHGVYSPKNRKYKPLTKDCMKELLSFYFEIEKVIEAKATWSLEDISSSMESFGRSVAPILNRGTSKFESKLTIIEKGSGKIKRYTLSIGDYKFVLSKNTIKTIYKILKKIKESIALSDKRKVPAYHFLFLGEQREISNNIVNEISELPKRSLARLVKGSLIPGSDFEKNAIASIKKGSDQSKEVEGLHIYTTTKFSYVLVPLSDVGYEILQAFHVKPKKLKEPVFLGRYKVQLKWNVPSIFNEDFQKLTQVVFSLLVQYHVSFVNFNDITTCCECNKLTFKNKNGKDVCSNQTCIGRAWRRENPRNSKKTNCRKNQNIWLERNTGRDGGWVKDEPGGKKLNLRPSICVDCDVNIYPPGGKCPKLRKEIKDLDKLVEQYKNAESGSRIVRRSG